jgi:hypothetical protein
LNKEVAAPGLENRDLTAVGIRCADHVTPLYPQRLALTSPTGGGRSVGIVRPRTKATEFLLSFNKGFLKRPCAKRAGELIWAESG